MLLRSVLVDKKKSMAVWGGSWASLPSALCLKFHHLLVDIAPHEGFDETILAQVEHHK